MITAIVRFPLAADVTREAARALFEKSAPLYQAAPGLIRKYYLYDDAPSGGGVYLWESREAAEGFFTPQWRVSLAERLGAEPQVSLFETPVIIENRTGEVLVD